MKILKKLLVILSAIGLTALTAQAAYIYEYGSFDKRAEKAVECGIVQNASEYKGTYEQNISLEKCYDKSYMKVLKDPYSREELDGWYFFGSTSGIRPSDFAVELAESLAATASTTEEITVDSLTTTDGHTLTSADIGDFICFHINPQASNDELVCCTGGITGTTFNDCTRGYGFYNRAAVSGNEKAHSIGEDIIISDDDVWLATQYTSNDDDETIYGDWTFGKATTTSSKPKLRIGNGYLWYDYALSIIGFASTTGGTEYTFNSGGTSFSAVPPLNLLSSELRLGTTTNNYDFNIDNNQDFVIRKNNSVTSTADGLSVATTSPYYWTGLHTFTAEATFTSSTTQATSTIDRLVSDGLVKAYTAGESITADKAVYATSSRVLLADDDTATSTIHFIGMSLNSANDGGTVYVQTGGIYTGQSGLDEGFYYYVSDSGAISSSSTAPTVEGVVGLAIADDQIDLDTKVGWQFISYATDVSDVFYVPHWARMAIIQTYDSGGNIATKNQLILLKNGNRSAEWKDDDGGEQCLINASWNTAIDQISLSFTGGCNAISGTAYFYR